MPKRVYEVKKMDYYKANRDALNDLNKWIQDLNRPSWVSFCRTIGLKYGFAPRKMIKFLKEHYPMFAIDEQNGELVAAEGYKNVGGRSE